VIACTVRAITGTERIRRIRDGRKRAAGALPGNSENKHYQTVSLHLVPVSTGAVLVLTETQ
jgi:hypothetical protein